MCLSQPQSLPWLRVPRRMSHGAPPSPGHSLHVHVPALRYTDDEEEYSPGHLVQYIHLGHFTEINHAVHHASNYQLVHYETVNYLAGHFYCVQFRLALLSTHRHRAAFDTTFG